MRAAITLIAVATIAHLAYGVEVSDLFLKLERQWSAECLRVSDSSQLADYMRQPSAAAIIAMGPPAIPEVIKRLQRSLENKKLREQGKARPFSLIRAPGR